MSELHTFFYSVEVYLTVICLSILNVMGMSMEHVILL